MRFRNERRQKTSLEKELWEKYVFNKQTVRELSEKYDLDRRVVKDHLDAYTPSKKIHRPREINLLADGTYWGERKEETSWCSVVARDPREQEDLWWEFPDSETTSVYLRSRLELERQGYTLLSVTGDGFSGIKQGFWGVPYQMCMVHMERLVTYGTTKKPELEAGVVLLALTKSLYETDSQTFDRRLRQYFEKFGAFLHERTQHPISGDWSWTHEGLKQAFESLVRFQKYLFTFEQDMRIPKTTNSLEGHFRHVEDIVNVHCGLTRPQKERVLHSIFLAGSIAPSKKKLDEIM